MAQEPGQGSEPDSTATLGDDALVGLQLLSPGKQTISASASSLLAYRKNAASTLRTRSSSIEELFSKKSRIMLGRSSECDICISHPTISRVHAMLERRPEGLLLSDLKSVNGVFVEGKRITDPALVRERERIGIGPFFFSISQGLLLTVDNSQSLRLVARSLVKDIALPGGKTRRLLDNINLAIEPGEFVSLLGPSGSGKSTLMDCLNGRRPATAGSVQANGEDFYRHYDSFRQSLGYVPQRDIVHWQLSVSRALFYTARLRLPADTDPHELEARVEDVLGLMELLPHRNTIIGNLSGGQIKRVSLGAELLARPCLLYIDEATSGLDAGTEARIMRLFRELADEGKSVICITHNVDNVDRCNLILILLRGKLIFLGPPRESLAYFDVQRVGQIYDRLAEEEPETWESLYARSDLFGQYVTGRLAVGGLESSTVKPAAPEIIRAGEGVEPGTAEGPALIDRKPAPVYRPPVWHQLRILTHRYAELIWGDRKSFRLMMLQAPIVAIFVLLGFINKPYEQKILAPRRLSEQEREMLLELQAKEKEKDFKSLAVDALSRIGQGEGTLTAVDPLVTPEKLHEILDGMLAADGPVLPDKLIVDPRYTYMLLFIIAVTVMWLGCNNAAKEIVKEEAIYGRERAVNLGITPYLASKFLVLALIASLQTLLVMGCIYGSLAVLHLALGHQRPYPGYCLPFSAQYGILTVLGMCGTALGLLLSAVVSTPDRANSLLPYVLIPQIILGGAILPIKDGPLFWVAFIASPVYWAFRGIRSGATTLPGDLPVRMTYDDSLWIVCLALGLQTLALLAAAAWCLRRKDLRKA